MAGMKLATAYYELVPSMGGNQGQITQQFTGVGEKASRGFGKSFAGGLKAAVGPAVALLGAASIGSFLKDSVAEARESQKVGALTASNIKATGGAANVTAKQVGNLAAAISNKSGMDDEAIQSGANMLLTFKNIRNEAGKGNKIFDQATQAAVDLSAAGFGSVSSASVLMGKALNDPIKGVTALGKSGVTFTDQQKEQIKTLVESGKTLDAQKIILKEVNGQVGGAAAATATDGEKLSVAFGNLKESIGTALLPILDRVATFLVARVIPALYQLPGFFRQVKAFLAPAIAVFQAFFAGTGEGSAKLDQFRATVSAVFASVKSIFTSAVSIIRSLWATFGGFILQYAKAAFTNILTIVRGAFTILQGIFQTVSALLRGDWKGVWDGIKTILRGALTLIRGLISQAFNVIRLIFKSFGAVVKGIFKGIWSGLGALARAGLDALVSAVRSIPGRIRALGGLFKSAGKHLLDALLNGLKGGAGFVSQIAGKVWDAVKGMLNAAIRKINAALDFKISIPGPDIHVNIPDIPQLAKGGIVNRPTLALIGEAGPEAVVPLSGRSGAPVSHADGPTADQIERLISATEAARQFYIGQRQFAEAVQDANRRAVRL